MTFPVPETLVRTSHSLTIVANGVSIGLINGWSPTSSRGISPIYQIGTFINRNPSGDPLEKVPGNVTGLTMAVQRYDLYTQKMETAFGTPDLTMLSKQDRPFDIRERWQFPVDRGGGVEILLYSGCWFSNIGKNYRSDGDRIVNVNATIEYTRKDVAQAA